MPWVLQEYVPRVDLGFWRNLYQGQTLGFIYTRIPRQIKTRNKEDRQGQTLCTSSSFEDGT